MELQRLLEVVRKSEEVSNTIAKTLSKVFLRSNPILVLYCGNTEGLAQHICSTVRVAKPLINIAFFDGEYSYNIVLPYIAEDIASIIFLAGLTEMSCVYKVLQTLSLVGVEAIALLPTIVATKFKESLERFNQNVYVLTMDSDIYRLSILQASLRIALTLSSNGVARVKRFEKELDIKSVVEELAKKYSNIANLVKGINKLSIAVSKALLSAGEELMDRGIPVAVIGKHYLENILPNLLIYTSVEEHIINEYLTMLARKGVKKDNITIIKLNTDPFTAPIYALIIFHSTIL